MALKRSSTNATGASRSTGQGYGTAGGDDPRRPRACGDPVAVGDRGRRRRPEGVDVRRAGRARRRRGANSPHWIVANLAVLAAGGAVLPLNPRSRDAEVAEILERAACTVVLGDGV